MENKQLELWNKLNESNSLSEIQKYIKGVLGLRGFNDQTAEQKMLLLTEEVGELAKTIRKDKTKLGIDKNKINNYDPIESEVADVFIVLVSICNALDVDLFKAVKEKEKENINRKWKQKR